MTDAPKDKRPAAIGESGYERIEGDTYFTPAWVTRALLRQEAFRSQIWEPAAGAWLMADVLKECGHSVHCSDIKDYGRGNEIRDFLEGPMLDPAHFDIVCNPPFKFSNGFVSRALHWAESGGAKVAFLLPIAWSAAKGRTTFLRDCAAFDAKYEFLDRIRWMVPAFKDGLWDVIPISALNPDGEEKAPQKDHAWFVWNFREHVEVPRIDWLSEKEERQERLL